MDLRYGDADGFAGEDWAGDEVGFLRVQVAVLQGEVTTMWTRLEQVESLLRGVGAAMTTAGPAPVSDDGDRCSL